MTPFPARFARLAGAMAIGMALVGIGAADAAGPGASLPSGLSVQDGALALLAAQNRSAKADAVVDGLKRALTPGHLVDPLPEGGSSFALEGLRADYSDMQRRAAGYRATLGEHHPTLATAALVLAELKDEITEETRRVLGAAERDAAQAHAALNLVERAAAARSRPAEDATGSIAAATPSPAAVPSAALQPAAPETAPALSDATAQDEPAQAIPAPDGSTIGALARRAAASAGALLAVTAALWAAVSRFRRVPKPAPRHDRPSNRREPAWVVPAAFAAPAAAPETAAPIQDTPAQETPAPDASAIGTLARRAAASAGVLLAVTAALWAAVSRSRRVPEPAPRRDRPGHRREPAWVVPPAFANLSGAPGVAPDLVSRSAAPDPVARPTAPAPEPMPATLPVTGLGAPRDVAAAMAQAPDGILAHAAASLLATLAAAHGDAGRMTVLVLRTEDVAADQGDGAALALAIAAAARGRRVALLEARPAGRLRRSTVPAGTEPMVIAAGGTARTAYRVADGGAVVVVLPSDAGEAEVAAEAARRDGTLRLGGLDLFDLVVMVGERAAALSRAADVVLVVAGPATAEEAVAAASKPCRALGRTCRTLTLEPAPVVSGHLATEVGPARDVPRAPAVAAVDVASLPDLRGSFDVEPDRLVA